MKYEHQQRMFKLKMHSYEIYNNGKISYEELSKRMVKLNEIGHKLNNLDCEEEEQKSNEDKGFW